MEKFLDDDDDDDDTVQLNLTKSNVMSEWSGVMSSDLSIKTVIPG
jgi:hypothetical protein